jgi:MFS family permease
MSRTPAARPVAAAPGAGSLANSRWPDGHPRRRQILLVLCLSLLVVVIDNTILNTALPTLARVLHASTTDLQWITDAYTLTFAALLVMAGRARRPLRPPPGSAARRLVIFALGSAWAALSGDSAMLIAARALMGVGAAFVMPATLSILNGRVPGRRSARRRSRLVGRRRCRHRVGPTLGGLLLAHFYWGSVFWVNVPLVASRSPACHPVVPDRRAAAAGTASTSPAVLVAGAMLAIVDAVIEGPNRGWTSAATLAEPAPGAALGAFVWRELRTSRTR